jgi:hypothetical protein
VAACSETLRRSGGIEPQKIRGRLAAAWGDRSDPRNVDWLTTSLELTPLLRAASTGGTPPLSTSTSGDRSTKQRTTIHGAPHRRSFRDY